MKNWIKSYEGNWINLNYIRQIRIHQHDEKWYVVGDLDEAGTAYLLSQPFEEKAEAFAKLQELDPNL